MGQHSAQPRVLVPCSSLCLLLCSSFSLKYWTTLLYYFIQEGRPLLICLLFSFYPTRVPAGHGVPVTSVHLLCLSFPSLHAGCVYCQCRDLHTPVNTSGAKLLFCVCLGPRLAAHGVSSALLLLSEGCTVLGPGWGPGERGAAFLPLCISKTVSRNQFWGAFAQSNQCS